jgi:hypothetical protein
MDAMQTPSGSPDYVRGYREGLIAGFDQGTEARLGPSEGATAHQKVAAGFVLLAGIVGAAGVVLTTRKNADMPLGLTVIVTSSVFSSVITALQILTSEDRRR